jgi:hypothetical protein
MEDRGIVFASPSNCTPRRFGFIQWHDFETYDFTCDTTADMNADDLVDTITEADQISRLNSRPQALNAVLPLRRLRPLLTAKWNIHRTEIVKLYIHEERELTEVR